MCNPASSPPECKSAGHKHQQPNILESDLCFRRRRLAGLLHLYITVSAEAVNNLPSVVSKKYIKDSLSSKGAMNHAALLTSYLEAELAVTHVWDTAALRQG